MAPQQDTGAGAEAELPEYAGQYRLESCLGSGGMGVVHLARSTSGLRLAVKVVHPQYARDPEFRGRFRQEVAAARRVSGAFTAPVVDADPEGERPWMATLYIPGPTLADHVKRNGPMPPAQLRRLMAGLAEALRDIHRVGVVHRDLKPGNMLLAEDGPKVIDFGISRPKDSELRTETGKLIGTPPFMAPEQFRSPREVGPATDVFALGSVMVHAATGRGPFDSDSPYIVAYQVVHDEPDLTGVPENLTPLVRRCLAKEPEDRPTTDELMRELRSVAAAYDTQVFVPAPRGAGDTPTQTNVNTNTAPKRVSAAAPVAPEPVGTEPVAAEAPPRPRRGLGRRLALVAGAVVLAAGGTLASVQMLGGGGGGGGAAPQDGGVPSTSASAADGFRGWATRPLPGNRNGMSQCSYGAGKLLCAQPGLISALDPADGSVLWRHPLARKGVTSGPPVTSGGLVLPQADDGRRLTALDPASGRTRWQRTLPADSGVRYVGGMTLITRADGTVTGVDSASGATKWSRRIPGQSAPYFDSFAGNPLAYATTPTADGSGTLVTAVDPDTGDVRWDARLTGRLQPVGAHDGAVFFASLDAGYGDTKAVVRYVPKTGATRRVALSVPVQQAQAAVHGDVVYLLGAGGSLAAVDLDSGRPRWRLETSVSRGSAPAADDRRVYVTAADGRLLAVDARKGRLVGQTRPRLGTDTDRVPAALPTPVLVTGKPGEGDGRVYASAPDGSVFGVGADAPARW